MPNEVNVNARNRTTASNTIFNQSKNGIYLVCRVTGSVHLLETVLPEYTPRINATPIIKPNIMKTTAFIIILPRPALVPA